MNEPVRTGLRDIVTSSPISSSQVAGFNETSRCQIKNPPLGDEMVIKFNDLHLLVDFIPQLKGTL
jgi:hypothetical protein